MNKSQLDADPKLVWRICFYLRDLKGCQKCGPEMIGEDLCTRGCYAKAEEVINIAQTGNAWRRGETTPKDPEALVKALERIKGLPSPYGARCIAAQALKDGKLGVMDYLKMQNVMADTSMRESLAGGEEPPKT